MLLNPCKFPAFGTFLNNLIKYDESSQILIQFRNFLVLLDKNVTLIMKFYQN